jgi:chromosome partitioning protein
MSWVISIGGLKGGTGKSTVAQGLAVEAVRHGTLTILADMDIAQQSSVQWAERRRASGIKPLIDVRLMRAIAGIAPLRRLCDLLVIDTPGQAGQETLKLAKASDLLLVTSGTNALELEPTLMLVESLYGAGIPHERIEVALTKVLDGKREAEARRYLKKAGHDALPVALPFNGLIHDVGNRGLAVTEIPQKSLAEQGRAFFEGIDDAIAKARDRGQEAEAARIQEKTKEHTRSRERGDRER